MTLLNMNTDTCRRVQSSLVATREQMGEQGTALAQGISVMVGATWQAPGAQQFGADFQSWQNAVNQMLDQLQGFATALDAEIDEWEQVAASY